MEVIAWVLLVSFVLKLVRDIIGELKRKKK